MTASTARVAVLAAAMLTMPLSTHGAAGEERYPSRPVKMIVPYPAGGPTDAIARLVANKLGAALGGSFYVENVPGAGGTLGARAAAAAAPDGYTLLWVTPDFVVQAFVKHRVPYDPFVGFSPISLVATAPEAIMVHPSIPAKTLYELVALLKANPGKYSYATPGFGSTPHRSRTARAVLGAHVSSWTIERTPRFAVIGNW